MIRIKYIIVLLSFALLNVLLSQTAECGGIFSDTTHTFINKITNFFDCWPPSGGNFNNKYKIAETYIPPLNSKHKIIKVNFNIFQKSDGSGNFTIDSIPEIIQIFNWIRSIYLSNPPNTDPPTGVIVNDLPDKKIDFVLNGIYFYQDDFLYNANCDYFTNLLNKIKQADPSRLDALNICITNGTYYGARGCANYLPEPILSSQNVDLILLTFKLSGTPITKWTGAQNIAHEIGHALGLRHTYSAAGTAGNAICGTSNFDYLYDVFGYPSNCPHIVSWSPSASTSPNDKITNNLMGGNADAAYLSPKQIGQCHRSLYILTTGKYTKCTYDSLHPWIITNNEIWDFSFRSFEDIWVKASAQLDIQCILQLTDSAHFIVDPGAIVNIYPNAIIENRCGCNGNTFDISGSLNVMGNFNIPPNSTVNIYSSGILSVDTLCINQNVVFNIYNGGKVLIKGIDYTNQLLQYNNNYNLLVTSPIVTGASIYAYNQIETQGNVFAFNTSFQAGRKILLKNGFKASSHFVAKIDTMINNCDELICQSQNGNRLVVNNKKEKKYYSSELISRKLFIENRNLHLIPNPANTSVYIQSPFSIQSITIKDISGKSILQQNISKSNSTTLDISALANGLYFVQVQTEQGVFTEKLVVRH